MFAFALLRIIPNVRDARCRTYTISNKTSNVFLLSVWCISYGAATGILPFQLTLPYSIMVLYPAMFAKSYIAF